MPPPRIRLRDRGKHPVILNEVKNIRKSLENPIEGIPKTVDKVYGLKQSERNETIFCEKQASPYKGRAVELFAKVLENTIKFNSL